MSGRAATGTDRVPEACPGGRVAGGGRRQLDARGPTITTAIAGAAQRELTSLEAGPGAGAEHLAFIEVTQEADVQLYP